MSLTLFAKNLLELSTTTVTVSPAAVATKLVSRVYDRDRSLQYEGGSAAQTDIDADLGSAMAASAWALTNYNITGVTVTIFGDTVTPPVVTQDTADPVAAEPFYRAFTTASKRYWRVRIPAMASAPKIGELFLGAPTSVDDPEYPQPETQEGNVATAESVAGYVFKVQRGDPRFRVDYHWDTMTDVDWATLLLAYNDTLQGAKSLFLVERDSTVRWGEFIEKSLRRTRKFLNVNQVDVAFRQAL